MELPPAYIAVGSLDLFVDENVQYAQRLMQSDVPTEVHIYPGGFHGFEYLFPEAELSLQAISSHEQALKNALFDK